MPNLKELKTKLPPDIYRKLWWRKEKDGFGNKNWSEWFTYLAKDITNKQTMGELISEDTRKGLLDLWLTNFADNTPYFRFGQQTKIYKPKNPEIHNITELGNPEPVMQPDGSILTEHSAIVVGAGPSVWKNNHLNLLATSNYKGYILATDRMLIPCLQNGIIPHLTVTVDGSPIIKKFYNSPLIKKHGPQLKIAVPTTVNVETTRTIIKHKCHLYWFNAMFDNWTEEESYTRILHTMSKSNPQKGPALIQCGGNCGATAWVFAWELLKASPIALIGIDFGYPIDMNLKETPYFSGILHIQKNLQVSAITTIYKKFYHPTFKTWAKADIVFQHYREAFLSLVKDTKSWVQTINTSEGGTLFGPRIECMKFAEFLSEHHK